MAATTSSTVHPAKHFKSTLPSSPTPMLRLGLFRSSCAGQNALALLPLREVTLSRPTTLSKFANIVLQLLQRGGGTFWSPHRKPSVRRGFVEARVFGLLLLSG